MQSVINDFAQWTGDCCWVKFILGRTGWKTICLPHTPAAAAYSVLMLIQRESVNVSLDGPVGPPLMSVCTLLVFVWYEVELYKTKNMNTTKVKIKEHVSKSTMWYNFFFEFCLLPVHLKQKKARTVRDSWESVSSTCFQVWPMCVEVCWSLHKVLKCWSVSAGWKGLICHPRKAPGQEVSWGPNWFYFTL